MFDDARSLWELIERRAGASPDRVMLYDGDRTTTFAQYRDAVLRVAAGYGALGIGDGSRVAWQLPSWTESAVLVGALARLGALQNPMLPIYRHREVAFITAQLGIEWLVTPSTWSGFDYAALARDVAAERPGLRTLVNDRHNPEGDPATLPPPPAVFADRADDPVRWVFYTSGTTADPKGAQHTDRSVIAGGVTTAWGARIGEDDIAMVAFPFSHIGGVITGVVVPLLTGCGAALIEQFAPATMTEVIGRHGVTLGNGAPAIHTLMLAEAKQHPEAYRTIRAFPSGGSAKPPQLYDDVLEAFPWSSGILSAYGMTEAPVSVATEPDAPVSSKRDGEGTPGPGVQVKILDSGEIALKGPQVMRGYADRSLDADAFTPDGWLRTGDLGRLDEHGALVVTGRLKDVIIRKGENVSAKEVEDVLFGHPKIADVAVLGLPDASRGEMVCACVVPVDANDSPTQAEIVAYCRERGMMMQKVPERIEIMTALPRTPSGKVPKHELRSSLPA